MSGTGALRRLGIVLGLAAAAVAAVSVIDTSPTVEAATASRFVPMTPARVHDTRPSGAPVIANQARPFQITGRKGVPSNATAVVLNVTAVDATAAGFLQVFPTGKASPGSSSTLNVDFGGQTIPNAAIAPIGDGGRVSVFTNFATHVIIDVFGYFVPATSATAGRLVPLQPRRILDTRTGVGWTPPVPPPPPPPPSPPSTPPPNPGDTKNCGDFATWAEANAWFWTYYGYYGDVADLDQDGDLIPCESRPGAPLRLVPDRTVISLQVAGRGGVPSSGVSAVLLNVTAVDPTASGWVQVAPTPVEKGKHSNLNPEPGRTIANLVVVPVGAGGKVDLYSEFYTPGALDLLADVVGYFTDGSASNSSSGLFVPLTPKRTVDTRQPAPQPAVASGTTINASLGAGVPGVIAVAGNLTSTGGGPGGWLQLASAPLQPGASSSLNTSYENQTIANAVISPIGTNGAQVHSYGSTHILLDVTGYFTGG